MTTANVSPLFSAPDPLDVAAADEVVRDVLRTQFGSSVPALVIVKSVAGGGKSTLLVELTRRVTVDRNERVAVAANTDYQSFLLTRRLLAAGVAVVLFVKESKPIPADLAPHGAAPFHVCRSEAELRQLLSAAGARRDVGIPDVFAIVANTAKWRSVPGWPTTYRAAMRPIAPLLVVDEAYQMDDETGAGILTVGERWVAVGDPGQIDPPTSADTTEWEHRPDGPHVAFPEAQLARTDPSSPGLIVLELPYTRRNPADSLPFIEPFYEQPVQSLVPSGSRRLTVKAPTGPRLAIDGVIQSVASGASVSAVVLPLHPTGGQTDLRLAHAIAATVRRLLDRDAQVLVDPRLGYTQLAPSDVMVIATHHDQTAQLAPLLPDGVQLGTADSLQGEDAPIVLAWHPLSGAPEPDTFHCDAGRTCVMLTRHTVALILFTRDGVGEMLDDQQPSDLLVPSNPQDAARRAWRAQRSLFTRLHDRDRVHHLPEA